ncbi:MAG: hypothetical protein SFY66_17755 [Oculatellaceae cyanobacterium bins.114]|nr:hypothetical protein [Oculatellaceae cyanobacterium bins.114]
MNPTVALTLILLFLMVAAGVVSGSWGYALGREALKGITQPDVRPSTALGDGTPRHEEVSILSEDAILADVKARMDGRTAETEPLVATPTGTAASPNATAQTTDAQTPMTPEATASPIVAVNADPNATGLPITSQDQGVTLEVRSVRQENGVLVLDVNLQNGGDRPVQFLYSFMNISDRQGRSFSANTEGLPSELQPNSESFSGTVTIPMVLLEGVNDLSIALTDYPDQQLRLKLSGIPVVR